MRALRRGLHRADRRRQRCGEQRSPAAEWLLDNFHVISAAARDIRHDLPPSFFRRLPRIAADEFAGLPRIYAMALELIGRSAGRLDPQRLHRFVTAFQSITPLTIGELWAWPSALKLALVEHLRARADVARGQPRASPATPIGWPRRSSTPRRRRALAATSCIRRSSSACCSARASTSRRAGVAAAASSMRALAARGQTHRGRDPRGGAAPGGRAGLHGEPDRQPAPDLDVRLERVLRERQPRRAGAAARSGRRLRPHGLPQPRPLSPRRRGAGRTDRRRPAARRAEERRARAAGRRADAGRARARTSAIT